MSELGGTIFQNFRTEELYPNGPSSASEASLAKAVYFSRHYFGRQQLFSQVSQLNVIADLKPKNVLEIGHGNGLVSRFLRSSGIQTTVMDINPNLEPDVVGDVTKIAEHFRPGQFDLIVCCEVLEHLPFQNFESILHDFSAISSKYVYLTLPRAQKIFFHMAFSFKMPFIERSEWDILLSMPSSQIALEHFWELDSSPETSQKSIKDILGRYYRIERFQREVQNPYHHHVVLKKPQS